MNERLNVRAAVVVLVVAVVAGGAAAGVNRWQVRRTAGGLLDLAVTAEEQGRTDRAARLLERYLQFAPNDADARARYVKLQEAQALARNGRGIEAVVEGYERVLEQDPGRADIRGRLARLYVARRQYPEAKAHLTALKAADATDPDLVVLLGVCHEKAGEPGPAEVLYRRAFDLDPKSVGRSLVLAGFFQRQAGTDPAAQRAAVGRAGEVLDRLVAASPDDPLARLARGEFRLGTAGPVGGGAAVAAGGAAFAWLFVVRAADPGGDLAAAVRLAPNNPAVRYAAARAAPDPGRRRDHLRATLEADPRFDRAYVALAELEAQDGKSAEAVAVLRRGAARLPGDPLLLRTLVERAIATPELGAERFKEAYRAVDELERWKKDPEQVPLLRGRVRMAEGKWEEAAKGLEAARPGLATAVRPDRATVARPELAMPAAALAATADLMIGQCYERLGKVEPALESYRRAAGHVPDLGDEADPDGGPRLAAAQAGVARMLERAGRVGEAVDYYRRLATAPGATAEAKLTYVRVRIDQYLKAPPAARRPADLEPAFTDLAAVLPGDPKVVLARVQVALADGQMDAAVRLLREGLAGKPDALEFGLLLAQVLNAQGKSAEAEAVLDGLAKAGDGPGVVLTRLQLLPDPKDPRAAALLGEVERRFAAGGEPDERARLAAGLADAYDRWRMPAEAARWWGEVAGLRPRDLEVRFRLLGLALQSGDKARQEAAARGVRDADEPGGPSGRYAEALVLLAAGKAATPADLQAAKQKLLDAAKDRPDWAPALAALGDALFLEGKPDEALVAYRRAIELGARQPAVVRRAVQLLYARGRVDEADRLVQRLGPADRLPAEMIRLAAAVSLANRQPDRAAELARQAVTADSQVSDDHLWQSAMLAAAGRNDDALAAARRAAAVAGPHGEPWVALVRALVRAGKRDEADRVIADLGGKLTGPELSLTEAQCHELAGRGDRAEGLFRQVAEARPGDPAAVRQVVGFYERKGDLPATVPVLRRALAAAPPLPPDDLAWARRALAAALARGSYRDFREGLALIQQNLDARPDTQADLLARARVYATRVAHRRDAIGVLEGLRKRAPLDPGAEFLYGQLLADAGEWAAARQVLQGAVAQDGDNPVFVRGLIDRLLRNNEVADARAWLDRLDRLTPGDREAARLRAFWLVKGDRAVEAVELLNGLSRPTGRPGGPTPADRVRSAAAVADDIGRAAGAADGPVLKLAEDLYRRAAAGGPADQLALVAHLGRRGKVGEALLAYQTAAAAEPLAAAEVLVGIAYGPGDLTPADVDRIDGELTRLLERAKVPAAAGMIRGVWAAWRGRYADAAAAFRSAAEAGGGAAALNNLAYMLVLSGSAAGEAEAVLGKVVEQVGLSAEVLDTRGMLRLAGGRVDEAVKDLAAAVDQEPTAARLVHLAAAYEKAGRAADAKAALARADGLKVDGSLALPAERAEYDRLAAARRGTGR